MYLYLGDACVISSGEVLGVFDLDHVTASGRTREFLEKNEDAGQVRPLGDNIPLSLVVTRDACYLSPIASVTLCRRLTDDQLM